MFLLSFVLGLVLRFGGISFRSMIYFISFLSWHKGKRSYKDVYIW